MLHSKIHDVVVTEANVDYDGSCAIDGEWLDLAAIRPYQQIDVYNKTNGERLTTYAIRAPEGSKTISLNGAAALKGKKGDRVIICAYVLTSPSSYFDDPIVVKP